MRASEAEAHRENEEATDARKKRERERERESERKRERFTTAASTHIPSLVRVWMWVGSAGWVQAGSRQNVEPRSSAAVRERKQSCPGWSPALGVCCGRPLWEPARSVHGDTTKRGEKLSAAAAGGTHHTHTTRRTYIRSGTYMYIDIHIYTYAHTILDTIEFKSTSSDNASCGG